VWAGLAPFSQTVWSLLRAPLPYKPSGKIWQKGEFGEIISMEKYTQLLLINHIWQSKNLTNLLTAMSYTSPIPNSTETDRQTDGLADGPGKQTDDLGIVISNGRFLVFAGQGAHNKDLTVWLDGARPADTCI
jgi:hypothetical protein